MYIKCNFFNIISSELKQKHNLFFTSYQIMYIIFSN